MKNLFLIMLFSALFCSGFTWGKSREESCNDADKLVFNHLKKSPDSLPNDLRRKVADICPGGAAEIFLDGLRYELGNQPLRAMDEYKNAIKIDEGFSCAHGRLGLLQIKQNDKAAAAVSLTKALEEGAKYYRYHVGLAELLLEMQAYPLAIYHYKQANILGYQYNSASLSALAKAYAGMNNWKDAEDTLRQAIKLSPDSPEAKSGLARIVIRQQRLTEGIQLLKQALALAPDNKSLHRELADAFNALGNVDAANKELKLAGVVLADAADTLIQQGDAYLLSRDFPAAIRKYKIASTKHASPAVFQKLGDAYLAVGNDDAALENYLKSIAVSPDDADVHYSVGVLLERKGDIDNAVNEYGRCLILDKNHGDAHRRLADIYALKGDLKNAISEFRKILEKAPDNPVVHFKLAKVYLRFGKSSFEDARDSLEAAIKLDPTNLEPRRELVKLEIKKRNLPRAEELCKEILALNRGDQQERKRLVGILGTQKKYDELTRFLTEESTLYPSDSMNYYRLGVVQMYRNNYQNAIQSFLNSIKIKPTAQSYHALARAYLAVSEKSKAHEALADANKLDPKKQEIKELVEIIDEELGNSNGNTAKKYNAKKKKNIHGSQ